MKSTRSTDFAARLTVTTTRLGDHATFFPWPSWPRVQSQIGIKFGSASWHHHQIPSAPAKSLRCAEHFAGAENCPRTVASHIFRSGCWISEKPGPYIQ
eukprot:s1562_g4.t1